MVVTATLARSGPGTKVGVTQDLQLSGAAAQYGRGMISDVTAVLMRDFSANLQDRIARAERGESPEQLSAAAAEAKGFTVGLQAAMMRCAACSAGSSPPTRPPAEENEPWSVVDRQRRAVARGTPVVIFLLNRVLAAVEADPGSYRRDPQRGVASSASSTGPEALAQTDSTIHDVAVGAVRYAGSVAKLLG